jgi:UDP-GlcNAc:undecaprenyl-phosphate GlcNAc-1-phosphate transferase
MTKWWLIYCLVWAVATALSAVLTLGCRHAAPGLGFVDTPMKEAHKLHKRPVPVLGGAGMFLAWFITIGGGLVFSSLGHRLVGTDIRLVLPGIQTVSLQLAIVVAGAGALVVLGMIDDRWCLDALSKFVGQFCIAGAVACWGVRLTFFFQSPLITWALTTFWILFVINAINFFDNMDGLAAGTAAIAALLFTVVAAIRGQYFVAVLAAATAGSASGFLLHNRPPASIFMGDAGSHFLGYLLAIIGTLTTFYTPSETPTIAPTLIPFFILGLPILDTFAVVINRLRTGKPIYVGDHTHVSHRFEQMGFSRAQSVFLVYLLTFAIGVSGLCLLWLPLAGVVLTFLQVAAIFAIVSILQYSSMRRNNHA